MATWHTSGSYYHFHNMSIMEILKQKKSWKEEIPQFWDNHCWQGQGESFIPSSAKISPNGNSVKVSIKSKKPSPVSSYKASGHDGEELVFCRNPRLRWVLRTRCYWEKEWSQLYSKFLGRDLSLYPTRRGAEEEDEGGTSLWIPVIPSVASYTTYCLEPECSAGIQPSLSPGS